MTSIQYNHAGTIANHDSLNDIIVNIASRVTNAYTLKQGSATPFTRTPDGYAPSFIYEGSNKTVYWDATIKDPTGQTAIALGSDRTRGKASADDVKEKEATYAQDMEFLDHDTRLVIASAESHGFLSPALTGLIQSFAKRAATLASADEGRIFHSYITELMCVLLEGYADRLVQTYRVFMARDRPREAQDSTIVRIHGMAHAIHHDLEIGRVYI